MFGKIGSLTKIFIKDFYQNTNLVSKETKKLNTKSIYFWMLVIVSIAMIYISYKAINLCISIGAPEIFVKFYMLFLTILLLIQITLICTNIFFFSKDLEFVLPLPVRSKELLIAKFNTILFMAYMTELIFGLVPLILYGFLNYTSFDYFVWMLLVLLLHPIVFITVISFFAIIIMKIFSFVKNKTVLQNIVSAILILLLFFTENKLMDHIDNSQESNYFITPIVQILTGAEVLEKLKYIAILITLDIVTLLIFVFLGQKFYLKTVLKNLTTTKRKLKLYEKKQVKVKNKTKKIGKEYVKKEFESTGISSDTSANIYVSMLTSKAWIDLTKNAKVLYLYCKAQYYAEKKKPNNNSLQFTMNKSKWNSMYKIYTNQNQFYKDMGMLIEHGFIKCIENGSNTRTKNI